MKAASPDDVVGILRSVLDGITEPMSFTRQKLLAAARQVEPAGPSACSTEKRIGALLMAGVPIISIDNVNGELGGDFLCQALTQPSVRARVLGKSEAPELSIRSAFFATGNNLRLVGDMTRRSLLCSLDAKEERPELRPFGFNPVNDVLCKRGHYVACALAISLAYRAAGAPTTCGTLAGYEEWTHRVRAPLIWLGATDPAETMEKVRDEDPELTTIRELFRQWEKYIGLDTPVTANDVAERACETHGSGPGASSKFRLPEFRDLLMRRCGSSGTVSTRSLGRWLRGIEGRPVDGRKLAVRHNKHDGHRYCLVKA